MHGITYPASMTFDEANAIPSLVQPSSTSHTARMSANLLGGKTERRSRLTVVTLNLVSAQDTTIRQSGHGLITRSGELELLRLQRPPITKRKNSTTRIVCTPNVPLTTLVVLIRLRSTERRHETVEIIKPRAVSLIKHWAYTGDRTDLFPMDLRTQLLGVTAAQKDGQIPRSPFGHALQTTVMLVGIQSVTHLRSGWVLTLRWTLLPFNGTISLPNTRQLFKWIVMLMRQVEETNSHKTFIDG
jgi:hypothetical protein